MENKKVFWWKQIGKTKIFYANTISVDRPGFKPYSPTGESCVMMIPDLAYTLSKISHNYTTVEFTSIGINIVLR